MKYLLMLMIGCSLCTLSYGQEQIGLGTGNYAGTAGLIQNPANGTTSRQTWDVVLIGGFSFLETNYAYLENTGLLDLYRRRETLEFVLASEQEGIPAANTILAEFEDDGRERYLTLNQGALGPGFHLRLESGHSFGIVTRLRLLAGGQNVPNVLSYYRYDQRPNQVPFPVEPFSMGMIGFGEVALNYGYTWPTYLGEMGVAVNLKSLHGIEGGYFENRALIDYTKVNGDTISSNLASLRYGLTDAALTPEDYQLRRRGGGWGLDIGFVMTSEEGYNEYYQWKLGASLLDVGAITFREDAQYHEVDVDATVVVPNVDYDIVQSLEDLETGIRLFSQQTLGDSTQSLRARNFTIWLPAALSVQGEYAITDFAFLHAMWIQRLPNPGIALNRGNLLAVTPRLEWRWWAVGIPLSLYNYESVQAGLFARLGPLALGTDNLAGWLGGATFSGYDFYCSLRVPFFELGGGNSGKRGGRGRKRGVKCYEF